MLMSTQAWHPRSNQESVGAMAMYSWPCRCAVTPRGIAKFSGRRRCKEALEVAAQQLLRRAANFFLRYRPLRCRDVIEFILQHLGDDLPAVIPLVNDLIENSRIGMLRDEARAQQFHSHTRDLFDQQRIVHEPPAAKKHHVAVLAGGD